MKGTVESFCIVFQPAGLFRLFSLPLHELTNEQVGVRPKLYARIARFEAALDSRARSQKSWTEVAHEFGYHDQMARLML